jgi:hypothetical protein
LAGLFGGCDMYGIIGSDSVGFKRTLLLQETLICIYLFELWFSPNICPGIGLLDQMVTLVLVGSLPYVKPASSRKVGNRFNWFSDGPLQRPNFQE